MRLTMSSKSREECFWERVQKEPGGCWLWTGQKRKDGYGRLCYRYNTDYAHRISYEIHKGPIPAGLHIDHLCRNTSCVNPDHLEAVTLHENLDRGFAPWAVNKRKTHCPQGHEYDVQNTIIDNGKRKCRLCTLERNRKRWRVGQAKRVEAWNQLPTNEQRSDPRCKLPLQTEQTIRYMWKTGAFAKTDLAKAFEIHPLTVAAIIRGKRACDS